MLKGGMTRILRQQQQTAQIQTAVKRHAKCNLSAFF